jgi:hypothetical protein
MTLDEAFEYVDMAEQSESEQRAEFGMGAVSLGFDPYDAMGAYDGYRCADDPQYAEARKLIKGSYAHVPAPIITPISDDDIPF